MRIAWATPFNERSSIARFSGDVTAELTHRRLAVEILRIETGDAQSFIPLPTCLSVGNAESLSAATLRREFDLVVVNLGDNFLFHGKAMAILANIPALIIFHDASMAGFMEGWSAVSSFKPTQVGNFRKAAGESPDDAGSWPDLGWLATLSLGAVVHSNHYLAPVCTACPGPVAKIALAHADPGAAMRPLGRHDGILVGTVGYINANKQADRIIAALGASSTLRTRARYRLIGPVEESERARLTDLARQAGIHEVEFTGWVSDDSLQALIGETDILCCLRHPILEGGSGSLITSLYSGRPVIVSDAGVYSEVPDNLVLKVPYGMAHPELTCALEAIAADLSTAGIRAAQAREWAIKTYSPKAYVDALVPHMEACLSAAPVIATGRELGLLLAGLTVDPTDPAAMRIGDALASFFQNGDGRGAVQA